MNERDSDTVSIGEIIANRYRILAELGSGGMAQVFRVRDLELDEDIALKILNTGQIWEEAAVEQFKQEIRLARRVVHQNVCRIYDFGRWQDLLFVTMELIEGQTLSSHITSGSLGGLEQRLSIIRDVLAGLRAAHALGIIHQDIKPLNIMITPEQRAVVMDFGIAHEVGDGTAQSAGPVGTPSYIAPELLMREPAGNHSDIYSVGILLFEMMAGRLPFVGGTAAVFQAHLFQEAPRVREFNAEVPEAIDCAVHRMLAKAPGDRYGSVDEVLAALAEVRLGDIGRTVLCAMGDAHLQALIGHHLEAVGLVIRRASDGEQAIEYFLKEKPDLMLVDVEVLKIDGLRIVEMTRRLPHGADVPVYVMSRIRNPAYASYANQLGVKRFITRPFESRALARELRDLMREG